MGHLSPSVLSVKLAVKKKNTLLGLLKIPLDDVLVRDTSILGELDSTATASSELPRVSTDYNLF